MEENSLKGMLEDFIRIRAVTFEESKELEDLRKKQEKILDEIKKEKGFDISWDLEGIACGISNETAELGYRRGFNDCIKVLAYFLNIDYEELALKLKGEEDVG